MDYSLHKVKFPCKGNVEYRYEFPVHFLSYKAQKIDSILYKEVSLARELFNAK